MILSERREALILAVAVWAIHAPLEMWILDRLTPLPILWALHGLALMLAMGAILRPLLRRSLPVRVLALTLLPVAFAVAQTLLDVATTYWIGDRLLHELEAPAFATVFSGEPRSVAALKLTFEIYLWPFGFYAAALLLSVLARSAYEARLAAQRAELEALRLQVNPHFLFNALNSVTSLIVSRRPDQAEAMTLSLARFYRNSLQADDHGDATLDDELDVIEAYLDLERLRLGDSLSLQIDCPDDARQVRIPQLLLQPLIENAIKHGDEASDRAAPILLSARLEIGRLCITIENPLPPTPPQVEGTGTGLINIRRRLHALYGRSASLSAQADEGVWRIALSLPTDLSADS